jgi:hypothetical protein
MVIMQDALPGIKRFLKPLGLKETTERHVTSFIVAFVMHLGRMSAATASSAIVPKRCGFWPASAEPAIWPC